MIYTLGKKEIYERYLASDPMAAKRKGGSVWRTLKSIQKYKNKMEDKHLFGIYGVEAKWNKETRIDINGDGWHELLKNARLVKL
jgi:hypothetical protein